MCYVLMQKSMDGKWQPKAQAVPESTVAGQPNISMLSTNFPPPPRFPHLAGGGPGAPSTTTGYNDNMSLPSSIAPPKQGVPYIDKYELRYGDVYRTADEDAGAMLNSAALCLLCSICCVLCSACSAMLAVLCLPCVLCSVCCAWPAIPIAGGMRNLHSLQRFFLTSAGLL
jgi:hypothetical protein